MNVLTLDELGRIALPQKVLEQAGLGHATQFNLEIQDGKLILEPLPQDLKIYHKDGVLVFEAEPIGNLEGFLNDFIDELREERIAQLASW
ncbi:MAG: AbrB/MazE/SpoVT family DNA-binding domain-containing protein [Oscillatoria sp. SIO1A7]|nr:AbrB/MazE/SpoVT family DNA-binding domain-containing protein [Oscillatoria sp. SIO1A7]